MGSIGGAGRPQAAAEMSGTSLQRRACGVTAPRAVPVAGSWREVICWHRRREELAESSRQAADGRGRAQGAAGREQRLSAATTAVLFLSWRAVRRAQLQPPAQCARPVSGGPAAATQQQRRAPAQGRRCAADALRRALLGTTARGLQTRAKWLAPPMILPAAGGAGHRPAGRAALCARGAASGPGPLTSTGAARPQGTGRLGELGGDLFAGLLSCGGVVVGLGASCATQNSRRVAGAMSDDDGAGGESMGGAGRPYALARLQCRGGEGPGMQERRRPHPACCRRQLAMLHCCHCAID